MVACPAGYPDAIPERPVLGLLSEFDRYTVIDYEVYEANYVTFKPKHQIDANYIAILHGSPFIAAAP